jgi:hypothetical protein
MKKKSGLADSPFFSKISPETRAAAPMEDLASQTQETSLPEPVLPAQEQQLETKSMEEKSTLESKQTSLQTNKQTSLQTNKQASLQESKHVSKKANKQTSLQTRKHASMQANVQAYLSEKVDDIATFRYPVDLLEKLEDVIHQVRKQHHRKVTKQAVAVAALAFLLTDFEEYGEESVLYQLLIKSDS